MTDNLYDKRLFDLNIEEVLDHWEVEHALREIIANALDEELLTGSSEVEIYEDDNGIWHVRDFGRGLAIEHFTLNENAQKLAGPSGVIGKFGVGLKDALATFHRRGVEVTITSRHGRFELQETQKHEFDGITTLHVMHSSGERDMSGTDVSLSGVTSDQVTAARLLFLRFAGEQLLERTEYGDVFSRQDGAGRVYISGVLANEEPNFLFTYNITNLTDAMRKRLNRERLDVGRTTYVERVKTILRTAQGSEICDALADQVGERAQGRQCDEMQWIEVAQRALNLLHQRKPVAFVTEEEVAELPNVVDNMRGDGLDVVMVSEAQKGKLDIQFQGGDRDLRTVEGYVEQYNESFSYEFIEPDELTGAERGVFDRAEAIIDLLGPHGFRPPVLVSETIRVGLDSTEGVWDAEEQAIILKRDELRSLESFAGTLLHELAHARTGAVDATRHFENILTSYLGQVAAPAVRREVDIQEVGGANNSEVHVDNELGTDIPTAAPDAKPDGTRLIRCVECGVSNRVPNGVVSARCGKCGSMLELGA